MANEFIFLYVIVNLLLFILYKCTDKLKILHRIISLIDNLVFCLLIGYDLYLIHPVFIIFIPSILLIVYPIVWGLNEELSDEDLASLVNSPLPFSKQSNIKFKVGVIRLATFPFYYLLESWQKTKSKNHK